MKKKEQIIGWLLFTIVFVIYVICSSHTISFWDSAEFISSNYKLQVTHPPGSPFYMLICNVIMGVFPFVSVAFLSNIISGFFGALTVMIVYFITMIITKNSIRNSELSTNTFLPIINGIISGLTLAFIHSFWISSTETEVYTLSFLLLVTVWYLAMLWLETTDRKRAIKLLFLIALLLGLSSGVHLINISIVIPISLIFIRKKYKFSLKNIAIGLGGGVFLFLLIYGFAIQGFLKAALQLDIYFVNTLSFQVNSGLLVLYLLFLVIFFVVFWLSITKHYKKLLLISGCLLFFYIGISPYGASLIRANGNTPISNNPSNSLELLKYIKAEQFGVSTIPLLKGYYFNAPLDKNRPLVNGKPKFYYDQEKKQYIEVDDGVLSQENFAREFSTFFPRMFSTKPADISGYNTWTTVKGESIVYPIMDKNQKIYKPTFKENLSLFYNYQVNWLYLRYLFWNFTGKQNDNKGAGTILNGNWISGFEFLDANRVGESSKIPKCYKNDLSKDVYYFLPFIFGLLGLFFLRKSPVHFFTSLLFFFTFGLGITLYVNPTPSSILIRERDYIFIGSFIPFCIWIGLAVTQLYQWFSFISNKKVLKVGVSLLMLIAVPAQLLVKGWDDHNRQNDTFARDFAKGYLDSCPLNTILITNGDNMTFPLWYLQEVENYRTDVRVVNFDQLNLDWYIEKLKLTMNTSKGIKVSLPKHIYKKGPQEVLPLQKETNQPVNLDMLFQFLANPKSAKTIYNKQIHYIPSDVFSISVDTLQFAKQLNTDKLQLKFIDKINWKYSKDIYGINDLSVLNIVQENINERPIAFAINGNTNHYVGLKQFTIQKGMVELLAPVIRAKNGLNPKIVDTETSYNLFKEDVQFKDFIDTDAFIDYENRAYAQQILRRNYYFLAQALLEENQIEKAKDILDTSIQNFPNATVPFKQYAFAIGKLYFRTNAPQKGEEICLTAIKNLKEELEWLISFNPPNPIINVRYANRLKTMYFQMIHQFSDLNLEKGNTLKEEAKAIEVRFQKWYNTNWPY
ncbi:DUF2723 domain-containing protein [uncultured Tenacibaculum sp.]|uniref:glycosyltransferase family 117 protein n=1 Tax=uncultured Tenacibaculum sp. TaxID=174713 RepID=UPI00262C117F|nr:DUF2723 domain-containing protein [uncultured Tenacibaculum sp.]